MKNIFYKVFKIKYLLPLILTLVLSMMSIGFVALAADDGCTCGTENSVHSMSCDLYTATTRVGESASINVSLFSTASHVAGTGVTLTESGLTDYVWSHDSTRYLHVELTGLRDGLAAGEHYQLVITSDPAVYFPNILPHSDWATS